MNLFCKFSAVIKAWPIFLAFLIACVCRVAGDYLHSEVAHSPLLGRSENFGMLRLTLFWGLPTFGGVLMARGMCNFSFLSWGREASLTLFCFFHRITSFAACRRIRTKISRLLSWLIWRSKALENWATHNLSLICQVSSEWSDWWFSLVTNRGVILGSYARPHRSPVCLLGPPCFVGLRKRDTWKKKWNSSSSSM